MGHPAFADCNLKFDLLVAIVGRKNWAIVLELLSSLHDRQIVGCG
jgi:hypothetical protein